MTAGRQSSDGDDQYILLSADEVSSSTVLSQARFPAIGNAMQ